MDDDLAARHALDALERGDRRSASLRYEEAAHQTTDDTNRTAHYLHLAGMYEDTDNQRADYLYSEAQVLYERTGRHDKVMEVALARASLAEKSGAVSTAGRSYRVALLHAAAALVDSMVEELGSTQPSGLVASVSNVVDTIVFSRDRLKELEGTA